jgi:hypothetical protein
LITQIFILSRVALFARQRDPRDFRVLPLRHRRETVSFKKEKERETSASAKKREREERKNRNDRVTITRTRLPAPPARANNKFFSNLSTTFSTPRFPTTATFSCPSALNRKIKEHAPAKLSHVSSNAKIAENPPLGLEYVSMLKRANDSGQLKRYSLLCPSNRRLGVVLTRSAFRVPSSYVKDAHERSTSFSSSSLLLFLPSVAALLIALVFFFQRSIPHLFDDVMC